MQLSVTNNNIVPMRTALARNKDNAQKEIQQLLSEALKKVREAEELAKQHKLAFHFDVAYGMGGTFNGTGEDSGYNDGVGWNPSSHSC